MQKSKEECLLNNGIIGVDVEKIQEKLFKAMDDFAKSAEESYLQKISNALVSDKMLYLTVEKLTELINKNKQDENYNKI